MILKINQVIHTTALFLMICCAQANISCPIECQCNIEGLNFLVDCSNQGLTELPFFDYTYVHFLDISNNKFTKFPTEVRQLEGLEFLDVSYNYIKNVPDNALHSLTSLKELDLSFNNISNWADIHPNTLLTPAVQLKKLSLAGNKFSSMTSLDEKLLLISKSLTTLDLSKNQISKVTGEYVFGGLKKLERISLKGNPLYTLTDLVSDSLIEIDLSSCKLEMLPTTTFAKLPKLSTLNLSHNSRLSIQFVQSMSVKKLDVSYCNMDNIILEGFPNLQKLSMSFNMINYLSHETFDFNRQLESIDLSSNSISFITVDTFKELPNLRDIDLSYNSISVLDRELFKHNSVLLYLNLAQNFIQKLMRLSSSSLIKLNVSGCEIIHLDRDTIGALPLLNELDLSHNLISELPPYLHSNMLQILHLRNNRILKISNLTFYHLPELTWLDIAGNRLTNTLRRDMFTQNRFLQKIRLGDNPWICDCARPEFFDFYQYLMEPPMKNVDRNNVKCFSPEEAYGQYWENACYLRWFPNDRKFGITERIWMAVMIAVVVCCGLYCLYKTVQRGMKGRELTRREREREETISEAEEIARQTRIRLQQEALLNAPDPREVSPPNYEEALRMPKPIFASLDELSSRRSRRKRRAQKIEEEEGQEEVTETTFVTHRYRSEEVLSPRTSRVPPRLHPFELEALERTRELEDINNFSPQSPLHELEEFRNFDSRNASPYTKRREDSRRASPFKRRDRASNRKTNEKVASLEELHQDSSSNLTASSSSSQPRNSIENLKHSQSMPGPSMTHEASRCLEEEIQILDEQIQINSTSKCKTLNGSIQTLPSSSSINDIEVISREDIERISTTQEFVVVEPKEKR